jgi:hypothetical protein
MLKHTFSGRKTTCKHFMFSDTMCNKKKLLNKECGWESDQRKRGKRLTIFGAVNLQHILLLTTLKFKFSLGQYKE